MFVDTSSTSGQAEGDPLRVIVIGGAARARSFELTGPLAGLILPQIAVGTLFLGVEGLDRGGEQVRLVALLDNLGKGASGAAVQNLNLMLGLDEAAGLA